MDNPLDGVEIARRFDILAFYPVLLKIDVETPVHAFYRPVRAHQRAQFRGVRRQTRQIQPGLGTALSFKITMKGIAPLTRFGWESGNFLRCVSVSYRSIKISNFSFLE